MLSWVAVKSAVVQLARSRAGNGPHPLDAADSTPVVVMLPDGTTRPARAVDMRPILPSGAVSIVIDLRDTV